MTIMDEGTYLETEYNLEDTDEYTKYLTALEHLSEVEEAEEVLHQTSTLDIETVANLENRYPGLVVDNTIYTERYTEHAHRACVESLTRKKNVIVSDMATSFLGMLDNLNELTSKLKNTKISGGISETLNVMKTNVKKVEIGKDKIKDEKLIIAYTDFMGVEPKNLAEAKELVTKIGSYKNPIQCLKDFNNQGYDRMFTPLLANAVSDNRKVFSAFESMDTHYADAVVNNIRVVQAELSEIIRQNDHSKLSRFTRDMIPRDVDVVLNDIVAGLDISIDASRGLLKQSRHIGSEVSKKLRVTEESLNKKGSVVNAVTHGFKQIDDGFSSLSSATDKLAVLSDKDAGLVSEIQTSLKQMRGARSKSVVINQVITPVGRQASQQYRRIMNGVKDLWQLVNLFVRLSVAYVTCYSVLKITLDKFSLRLLVFLKTVGDLKT